MKEEYPQLFHKIENKQSDVVKQHQFSNGDVLHTDSNGPIASTLTALEHKFVQLYPFYVVMA